jgi:hypothetical protein
MEADATAYVDQYDDLSTHDIGDIGAFDIPLARKFRAKMLPETEELSVRDFVPILEDEKCAVCKMMPANFPSTNAQLSFQDGTRVYFC